MKQWGLMLLAVWWLTACQSMTYYGQSVNGQWQILTKRQPIQTVITQPTSSPALVKQLQLIQQIRAFAQGLSLPVKGQYDTYVDIKRTAAMWSVAATPELSLKPKIWCYWGIGCLSYRSFFEESLAQQFDMQLKKQGYDTHLSRVTAYSTLGWFRDSVLSSFVYKSEFELAELIFHELAHQVVYAKNDLVFNEGFAEVVANEGLKRYLAGRMAQFDNIVLAKKRQQQFVALVLDYRQQLANIYQSALSSPQKQQQKIALFKALQYSYQQLKQQQWQGFTGYDAWFVQLNNAKLNSVSVYNRLIPALTQLLLSVDNDLPRFYLQCQQLAQLSVAARHKILAIEETSDND